MSLLHDSICNSRPPKAYVAQNHLFYIIAMSDHGRLRGPARSHVEKVHVEHRRSLNSLHDPRCQWTHFRLPLLRLLHRPNVLPLLPQCSPCSLRAPSVLPIAPLVLPLAPSVLSLTPLMLLLKRPYSFSRLKIATFNFKHRVYIIYIYYIYPELRI